MADGSTLRIGQGFDSHAWSDDPGRPLVLGGLTFASTRALAGHSDADVVAHACADALLGAAGRGDIGQWFSDTDPGLAGADSMGLLATIVAELTATGWQAVNVDCVVVISDPKIAPRREEMQARLSTVVGAPVTVKGKRPEGLHALDGAACWAVALVERSPS